MDWFDLLAVQGALKSLLQHHSSEVSIHLRSAFFIVQLSYPNIKHLTTNIKHLDISKEALASWVAMTQSG